MVVYVTSISLKSFPLFKETCDLITNIEKEKKGVAGIISDPARI
jgi:hypothetical protein